MWPAMNFYRKSVGNRDQPRRAVEGRAILSGQDGGGGSTGSIKRPQTTSERAGNAVGPGRNRCQKSLFDQRHGKNILIAFPGNTMSPTAFLVW